MVYRLLISCLLSLLVTDTYAKTKDSTIWKNEIKIYPFKPFGFVNPGIDMGYERFINNRWSVETNVAYLTNLFHWAPYQQYDGARYILEGKYIFDVHSPTYLPYVSFSTIYNEMAIRAVVKERSQSSTYDDTVSIAKQTQSFNINIGLRIIDQRMSFNIVAGVGVKWKEVVHSEKLDKDSDMVGYPGPIKLALSDGNVVVPNIVLAMRLGWRF